MKDEIWLIVEHDMVVYRVKDQLFSCFFIAGMMKKLHNKNAIQEVHVIRL